MTPDFDSMLRQIHTLSTGIEKLKIDNEMLTTAVKLSHQYISKCVAPPPQNSQEAMMRTHVMTLLNEALELGGAAANAA